MIYYILGFVLSYCIAFECNYGTSDIQISRSNLFFLIPPRCDKEIKSCTVDNNLPSGIVLDQEKCGISGFTTVPSNIFNAEVSITSIEGDITTVHLNFEVINQDDDIAGVTVIWISTTDTEIDNNFVKNLFSGKYTYYVNQVNEAKYSCGTEESQNCPIAYDLDISNMYSLWFFRFTSKTSIPTISITVDDEAWVYVDDLTEPKSKFKQKGEYGFAQSFSDHMVMVLAANFGGSGGLTVSINNDPYSRPPPLQYVDWIVSDIILVKDKDVVLSSAIVYGGLKEWKIVPELPKDVVIDRIGRINGIPKSVVGVEQYNITGISYDNKEISHSLANIQILDNIKENMSPGLDGYYYSSSTERQCEYRNINTVIDILWFRKIDERINHPNIENGYWDGLSGKFISSFTVKWSGMLSVPTSDTYTIGIKALGGFRMIINGDNIIDSYGCSGRRIEKTMSLNAGLVDIVLYYWKNEGSIEKSLELFWSSSTMAMTEISDDNFVHIPRKSFDFEYEIISYVKGVEVQKNCPRFKNINKDKYTVYSSTPKLPDGLAFDDNHCISGIITEKEDKLELSDYIITIKGNDQSTASLQTKIQISYDTYVKPENIVYENIITSIGSYVNIKPTVIATQYVVQSLDKLPSGLNIDVLSGTISGNRWCNDCMERIIGRYRSI